MKETAGVQVSEHGGCQRIGDSQGERREKVSRLPRYTVACPKLVISMLGIRLHIASLVYTYTRSFRFTW